MFAVDRTVDDVIDALADFLAPFCPGAQIVQAQGNRVPMPASPCVVLTPLLGVALRTPTQSYDGLANSFTAGQGDSLKVQMDFYGAAAGEWAKAVVMMFRTPYAVEHFPAGIKPLYCGDAIQAPLVTGEQQYEQRWTVDATLQFNASVTVPQDFFDTASIPPNPPADFT